VDSQVREIRTTVYTNAKNNSWTYEGNETFTNTEHILKLSIEETGRWKYGQKVNSLKFFIDGVQCSWETFKATLKQV
jgi:hypothetical protein